MSEPISWTTESRRLGDLIEWDKNPRQLSAHDAEHIGKSIRKFGLADPLIINLDNHLIGGHQRKHILSNPNAVVDVRVPSRMLTEAEAEELAIRLNKNTGAWDFDALANGFEVPDLLAWGFDGFELGIFPEVQNDITANTTKAGQYDKSKMPVNIGKVLMFLSPDEQEKYGENWGVYYEEITDNPDVQEAIKSAIGKLADEIRDIISAD